GGQPPPIVGNAAQEEHEAFVPLQDPIASDLTIPIPVDLGSSGEGDTRPEAMKKVQRVRVEGIRAPSFRVVTRLTQFDSAGDEGNVKMALKGFYANLKLRDVRVGVRAVGGSLKSTPPT